MIDARIEDTSKKQVNLLNWIVKIVQLKLKDKITIQVENMTKKKQNMLNIKYLA